HVWCSASCGERSMSFAAVESIVQALLYEGYLLYPYRRSALKNRQRWLFGRVLPREFSLARGERDLWKIQTECLIVGSPRAELELSVRFLQLMESDAGNDEPAERNVPTLVTLEEIKSHPARLAFAFPPQLEGAVTLAACELRPGLFK